MSVKMTDEEIDQFLKESITATVITINPSGMPLPAPVWYVNKGPVMYFRTMRRLQKSRNIERDPRCVMQVEAGLKYLELHAVIATGKAVELTDPAEIAWFEQEMAKKYGGLKADQTKVPDATKKHYDNPSIYFKVVPEKVKTWDNRKIRLKAA